MVGPFGPFLDKTAHPRNSGSAVKIFLHNERGQGVDGSSVNGFPKTAYPHNFRSALRTFLKFCTIKGAKRFKIILMVFSKKKKDLRQMWRFGPKNYTFLILHKLRGEEVHENHINDFKISQVVLLKQILLQGYGEMYPSQ